MSKPDFNQQQIINTLQTNWTGSTQGSSMRWTGQSITYSIESGVPDPVLTRGVASNEGSGYKTMSLVQKTTAQTSFQLWKDLIAVQMVENQANPKAAITLNYSSSTEDGGTYAAYNLNERIDNQPRNYTFSTDRIWFSSTDKSNMDPAMAVGKYGQNSMIHEVGHAIGLSHPGPYNWSPNTTLSYEKNAIFANDTRQYSVMSYWGYYNKLTNSWTTATPDYDSVSNDIVYCQTPMLYDVLAIQSKYGANMATRTGDTVYGYNCNLINSDPEKLIFDFSNNKSPIYTIWDAGGNNTLDCSGYVLGGQKINLTPGTYSSVAGMVDNVAVAFNCKIQNAIGGTGDDVLIGGNLAPLYTLKGGVGNDAISGNQGSVAVSSYTANKSSYTITGNETRATIQDSVASRDGTDTLTFVQRLKFTDTAFALDVGKGEHGGEAYRIYQTAFNRAPDVSGLGYWINTLDNGSSLTSVAGVFVSSQEFVNQYGGLNNEAFVNQMYLNGLHRAADPSGANYWTTQLNNGLSRATLVAEFSESTENVTEVAKVIGSGFDYQMVGA